MVVAGSSCFSKRPDASVRIPSFLAVVRTDGPSKQADSNTIIFVSSMMPLYSPPMTPATAEGLDTSAMTSISGDSVRVTPSSVMRDVAGVLAEAVDDDFPVIICSKGVEEGSGLLPVEVFEAEMGNASRLAVLSGPNFAAEVIRGIPSGTVIAGTNEETAAFFQQLFASETFRTYVSDDVCGVELCAAFKNVIAIAVGVSYGIGFGDNTAAMLMTRGLAEMSRLVVRCGGQAITCMGLAGAGDLVATCTSEHSRNRRFGKMIAEGGTLDEFVERTHMVVEGALACKTLETLADAYGVELPITDVVRSVVWEGADPRDVAKTLTSRPLTTEFHGL